MSFAKWIKQDIEYESSSKELNHLVEGIANDEFKYGMNHFYLPIEYIHLGEDGYGNAPVEDPLTIRFGTTAFSDQDGMLFESSLTTIIDDMIDDNVVLRDGEKCFFKNDTGKFKLLAQALQNEVNKLNKLIDNAVEE